MPQTAIGHRNISNYNVFGCHEFYFECLLGRPGASNKMDFHAFLNIGRCEVVKKQLGLYSTQAPAFSFCFKSRTCKSKKTIKELQPGNTQIVLFVGDRASFEPEPQMRNT